jgi:hypothetical protein
VLQHREDLEDKDEEDEEKEKQPLTAIAIVSATLSISALMHLATWRIVGKVGELRGAEML